MYFILALLLLFAANAEAETWYVRSSASPNTTGPANSCELTDAQAALTSASNGDTIQLAAGSCTWDNGPGSFNFQITTKYITLRGAGLRPAYGGATSGHTTITAGENIDTLIGLSEQTGGNIYVENLTILVPHNPPTRAVFATNPRITNGKQMVLHHITVLCTQPQGERACNIVNDATSRMVVYRNIFTGPTSYVNVGGALDCDPGESSQPAWNSAHTMGAADTNGDNNAYWEDNQISYLWESVDVSTNCRAVFRYNDFTNAVVGGHGFDSGKGPRHLEVLHNRHHCGALTTNSNLNGYITFRGGVGVIRGNTFDLFETSSGKCSFINGTPPDPISITSYRVLSVLSGGGGWAPSYPNTYPVPRIPGWGWTGGATTSTQDGTKWAGGACKATNFNVDCGWTGVTITRSGSTATVTVPFAHNLATNMQVLMSGSTQTEYNGTFAITVTGSTTFDYTVSGTPATPATGGPTYMPHGISCSSNTVTLRIPGDHHLLTGESVTMQGSTQSQYNGTFTVTKVNNKTLTYPVASCPANPGTTTTYVTYKQAVRGETQTDGHPFFEQDLEPWIIGFNTDNSGGPEVLSLEGSSEDLGYTNQMTPVSQWIAANREYYLYTASFDGTVGIGRGTRASRPPTCTTGVFYEPTDFPNVVDKCTDGGNGNPALRWTDGWYTEYTYPHPLANVISDSPSGWPETLTIRVQ